MTSAIPHTAGDDRRYSLWWVVLLAATIGFAFQGTRGLSSSTEGRYAESSREMLVSGNYLEPTLSCSPHWTKPAFTYAAIATSLRVFGTNNWGARIPFAIAFVATAFAVAGIGRALWDERTGWVAGVVYACSPFPIGGAFTVSTDTFLTFFEILAVLGYVRAWRAAQQDDTARAWRNILLMYFAFGMAFFTKGPPALLPLLGILPWHFRQTHRPPLGSLSGIALGLVVGGWWFAVVIARHPDLLQYFVGEEIVARVATESAHRNPQWYSPFVLFVPPMLFGNMPWILPFFPYARRERLWRPRVLWSRIRSAGPDGLLLLWLLLPLLVFCLSKSRLILYVLPLSAPIALAAARLCGGRFRLRTILIAACLLQAFNVANKAFFSYRHAYRNDEILATLVRPFVADGSDCYLYAKSRFGVEFYIGRCFDRFDVLEDKREWADVSLADLLDRIRSGAVPVPVVLVTPQREHPEQLLATLDAQQLRYRTAEDEFNVVIKILAPPGAADVLP